MKTPHFSVLDSWRGIAACIVAIMHFMGNNHIYNTPVIQSAGLCVIFFFVLSGFVIFANYEDRLKQGYSFLKFTFLRFGRLYPLHLATLSAFLAIEVLQVAVPALQQYATTDPFSLPGEQVSDIVSNLFLFHALDLVQDKGFNFPSWSISAEFYTYIVFAVGIILFKNKAHIFCVVTAVLFTLILMWAEITNHKIVAMYGFFGCLIGFACGGLCWHIWKRYHDKVKNTLTSKYSWTILEVAILAIVYMFIDFALGTPFYYFAPLLCSVMLLIFAFEEGSISQVLRKPFFLFLGLISYSIYMVHFFISARVFPLAATFIEKKFDVVLFTVVDGKEKLGVEQWHGDLITLVYLTIVICVSYISYKLVEDPGRKLSRKLFR